MLNAVGAVLITQVLTEPKDAASSAAELAELQLKPSTPEFVAEVEGLLRRLEELGLVVRE